MFCMEIIKCVSKAEGYMDIPNWEQNNITWVAENYRNIKLKARRQSKFEIARFELPGASGQ